MFRQYKNLTMNREEKISLSLILIVAGIMITFIFWRKQKPSMKKKYVPLRETYIDEEMVYVEMERV
jgi:hypothetical protein